MLKLPVPDPLCTFCDRLLELVPYIKPRTVTVDPPSEVTLPFIVAPVVLILLAAKVITEGTYDFVVNCLISPYDVPVLFVA